MNITELFEAFDSSPELNWDGGHATKYSHGVFNTRFEVDGKVFLIDIAQDAEPTFFLPEVWIVSFNQRSQAGYRPTGNMGENATSVLGGVVSAVKDFISTHHPIAIGFSGKRKDRLGRLYTAMVNHMARDIAALGYRLHVTSQTDMGGLSDVILLYREGEASDHMASRVGPDAGND
jgi:hypothetical protein